MKKKLKKILFLLWLFLLISGTLSYFNYKYEFIGFAWASGVSLGKPYCLKCLNFYTTLLPPIKGFNILYRNKYLGDNVLLIHEFYKKSGDNYVARLYVPEKLDIFKKEDYYALVLFEIKLETTNDFMKACLKELDRTEIENKIEFCNYYHKRSFGEPYFK